VGSLVPSDLCLGSPLSRRNSVGWRSTASWEKGHFTFAGVEEGTGGQSGFRSEPLVLQREEGWTQARPPPHRPGQNGFIHDI
jgi:hypothetical protein